MKINKLLVAAAALSMAACATVASAAVEVPTATLDFTGYTLDTASGLPIASFDVYVELPTTLEAYNMTQVGLSKTYTGYILTGTGLYLQPIEGLTNGVDYIYNGATLHNNFFLQIADAMDSRGYYLLSALHTDAATAFADYTVGDVMKAASFDVMVVDADTSFDVTAKFDATFTDYTSVNTAAGTQVQYNSTVAVAIGDSAPSYNEWLASQVPTTDIELDNGTYDHIVTGDENVNGYWWLLKVNAPTNAMTATFTAGNDSETFNYNFDEIDATGDVEFYTFLITEKTIDSATFTNGGAVIDGSIGE